MKGKYVVSLLAFTFLNCTGFFPLNDISGSLDFTFQNKNNARPGFPVIISPVLSINEEIVHHTYYSLSYNNNYELPNWVCYTLKPGMIKGSNKRKNNFKADPKLLCGSAKPDDYSKSGYDRGHLLPAGDMNFSESAVSETFYMSNMTPQIPGFNRGVWKKLEDQVRGWAIEYSNLQICAGPVVTNTSKKIGAAHVVVPSYFFKVILDFRAPDIKAIGFIFPNESSDMSLQHYALSIDSVEHFTGIDFFSSLPDSLENAIEASTNFNMWNFKDFPHDENTNIKISNSAPQIQCMAITQKSIRCKRTSRHPNGFCTQHGGK